MPRVVLAMSGGVDSSVAAELLRRDGHEVIGVFMRHGEKTAAVCDTDPSASSVALPVVTSPATASPVTQSPMKGRRDHKQGCCTASDAADAKRVAAAMNIPFYALDLQEDFRRIIDYFVDDYLHGRTPNPCVRCNQWIKFGQLFDYADGIDAEFVATGHYARMVHHGDSNHQLHRGVDQDKDQSYALFGIRRDRLARMLLPVGGYRKTEIREIASSLGLGVAKKKDSQEICFVTQGHHREFIAARRSGTADSTAGPFVMTDGTVVGRHQGYEAFTVGQRKGLGIALGRPVFVTRIEPDTATVVLGEREDLLAGGLVADECNWLVATPPRGRRVMAQIRYNSPATPAMATVEDDGTLRIRFETPQSAVAPGQAVVVYDNDRVLGGGWIRDGLSASRSAMPREPKSEGPASGTSSA